MAAGGGRIAGWNACEPVSPLNDETAALADAECRNDSKASEKSSMKIAITGGTGFIGRYILRQLAKAGHSLRCWYRPSSDRSGLDDVNRSIEWLPGDLNDEHASHQLVAGCDAVVHAAL